LLDRTTDFGYEQEITPDFGGAKNVLSYAFGPKFRPCA